MTFRQRIFKLLYPLVMKLTKSSDKGAKLSNSNNRAPLQSIYPLQIKMNSGQAISLENYRGKKLLLVNTASNCGFTNQYDDLQHLYEQYADKLTIIGFPSNEFKQQEQGDDKAIADFCRINFGVTFPITSKTLVLRGGEQNEVYRWLTQPDLNGWNSHNPDWNFSKYLINENGVLTHYFGPSVSPLSDEVKKAVNQ